MQHQVTNDTIKTHNEYLLSIRYIKKNIKTEYMP